MENLQCYKVSYRDPKDGKISELKVTKICDSSLGLGFISLSGFIFEKSSILVNPEIENQIKEFENIQTLHISVYSIVRIAELGQHLKPLSFENDKSNLVTLPTNHQDPPLN